VEFTPDSAVITDISTGSQLAHGIADHGSRLYFFSHFVPKYISIVFLSQSNDIIRLCHEIFGHLNYNYLHQLSKENMVEGLPTIKFTSGVCQGCILGKHPEKKFDKGKAQRASSPLGWIHSDIMVPFPQPSISKARYVLTFIDDFSRFTWVFFLKLKSEVFECLIEFKALAENESGCNIKILRTDNGGEYFNKYVQQLCIDAGIQLQHTVPYTPQQNGVVERKNQSLKEMANCMLQSKSLASKLWDESINCEAYIQNRFPHKSLKGTTPFECWTGKKPKLKVSHFHIFGSRAWAHISTDKRKDLELQSVECIFVGYLEGVKGYIFLNSHTEKFILARSVKFEEESLHDFSEDPAEELLVVTDEEESKDSLRT
jgi:hypothetical protein